MGYDNKITFSIVGTSEEPNYPIGAIVYALEDLIKRLKEIPQEGNDTTGSLTMESEFVKLRFSCNDRRSWVK